MILPALSGWLQERKPVILLSLHPNYASPAQLDGAVQTMRQIFPHVYESDMKTLFDFEQHNRSGYRGSGSSMLGTWSPIVLRSHARSTHDGISSILDRVRHSALRTTSGITGRLAT